MFELAQLYQYGFFFLIIVFIIMMVLYDHVPKSDKQAKPVVSADVVV